MSQVPSDNQTDATKPAVNPEKKGMMVDVDSAGAGAGSVFTPLSNSTVMMIDDDQTTLDFVQKFLERAGYTSFISTPDSRKALPLITQTQPDIVLLDLNMPGVSGFEILAGIRSREEVRYTPVIILTAETDPETQLRALELGATDFLTKPVNPSELRLRVRNALAFKAYQDRLADFDALTGLMNRRKFVSQLDVALENAKQNMRACALLQLDLDRFKTINETLGPRTGDQLLCAVAQRMEQVLAETEVAGWQRVRSADMRTAMARIAGNGYAALLPNLHNMAKLEKATGVARELLAALAEPFDIGEQQVPITASIGIALYPDDGEDADMLMKNAETAMYQAKHQGGVAYEFFSGEMKARAHERLSMESQLRRAVERDELVLYFQPKVDISTQRIIGAEALLRWRRPEIGIVTPEKFMPLAEQTGAALGIGLWVLRNACEQVRLWDSTGLPPLDVAVNVASTQFHRAEIRSAVEDALKHSGLPADRLVLELKESALMENAERSIGMLYELKEIGVKLALNDFCMSTSSLVHLGRFPIDEVKIDRSFLAGLPGHKEKNTIVSAICALARELRFNVVAVGVETQEQLQFLREHNCEAYQGNLFSRPAPPEQFSNIVRRAMSSAFVAPQSSPVPPVAKPK